MYLELIEKEENEKAQKAKKMEETNHTWKSLMEKSKNSLSFSNATTNSFWKPTENGKASFKVNSTFSDALQKVFRGKNQKETINSSKALDEEITSNIVFKPIKEKLSLSRLYANDYKDCVAVFSPTMAYRLSGKDPTLLSEMYRTVHS